MSPALFFQGPTGRALIKSYLLIGLVLIGTAVAFFTLRVTEEVALQDRLTTRFIARFAAPTLLLPQHGLTPQQEHDLRASLLAIKDVTFPFVLTDREGRPHFWNEWRVGVPLPERYADLLAQDPRNPSDPHVRQVLELVRRFDRRREPIAVLVPGEERPIGHLHYGASSLGARVRWMPWLEAAAILVFMSVALLAFRNIKRSEQRSIWVGMAKETAHQLGTPLTSMNGWLALLSETGGAPGAVRPGAGGPQAAQATGAGAADSVLDREQVLGELARDLQRLTKVTERFSQIGRRPKLSLGRADQVAERVCAYFRRRLPHLGSHVRIESYLEEVPLAPLNEELLEWVLENLIKNALDAIDKAQGLVEVTCRYRPELQSVEILVSDNGKGMTPALQRRIFEPGFSTRKAGWGMGLVLVRRIVEEYHGGDVDVARSAPGVGTTMRVTLKAG